MHRFLYSPSSHVVHSICFTPKRITYENTYICFRIKLTQVYLPVVVDVAFGSKDLQVADIGLPSLVQFVRCLVQALVNIGTILDVANGAHGISPEYLGDFLLIEHASGHLS